MANRWKQWKKIVCHLASASSAQELVHWASLVVLLRCPPELCTLVAPAPTSPMFAGDSVIGLILNQKANRDEFPSFFYIIFPSFSITVPTFVTHFPWSFHPLAPGHFRVAPGKTRRLQRRPRPAAEAQELSETWRILAVFQKWDISMGYFFGIFLWDIFMGYFYWIFLWDIFMGYFYGIFFYGIFIGLSWDINGIYMVYTPITKV